MIPKPFQRFRMKTVETVGVISLITALKCGANENWISIPGELWSWYQAMRRFVFFVSSTLVLTCTLFAQSTSSSQSVAKKVLLTGTVYDVNGAVIISSQVVARSSRGEEFQTTTNTEGIYQLELPPDVYKIEANAPGFCPKKVEMFRVRKSSQVVERLSARTMPVLQKQLDFVLEVSPSDTPWLTGERPCKQKTMIKKEPKIRKPELFRSIAE
jgi:hypothetical protein